MLTAEGVESPPQSDPAPAVGGAPAIVPGNEVGSGEPAKLPGWTQQLTPEQQAEIKARVTADPKELDQIPKGLTELYSTFSQLKSQSVGAIKVPPVDAPKEAWDQFYKGLGRPESAEGYTLEKPQIPAGMRYDESTEKWFRGLAYAAGLNDTQAKAIYGEWNKLQSQQYQKAIEARKVAKDSALTALKQEWQGKFDENWQRMTLAYAQFIPGGQQGPLFRKIQAYGLDNDPDFLKMLKSIGDKIGPARTVIPRQEGSSSTGPQLSLGAGLKGRE